mmetsp:Transcript_17593/g.50349  ORF Transcript_17593/g.50349 Transcript_17593/m.50349 type:complete len:235 (+) Transcript_17593:102-806(+)
MDVLLANMSLLRRTDARNVLAEYQAHDKETKLLHWEHIKVAVKFWFLCINPKYTMCDPKTRIEQNNIVRENFDTFIVVPPGEDADEFRGSKWKQYKDHFLSGVRLLTFRHLIDVEVLNFIESGLAKAKYIRQVGLEAANMAKEAERKAIAAESAANAPDAPVPDSTAPAANIDAASTAVTPPAARAAVAIATGGCPTERAPPIEFGFIDDAKVKSKELGIPPYKYVCALTHDML